MHADDGQRVGKLDQGVSDNGLADSPSNLQTDQVKTGDQGKARAKNSPLKRFSTKLDFRSPRRDTSRGSMLGNLTLKQHYIKLDTTVDDHSKPIGRRATFTESRKSESSGQLPPTIVSVGELETACAITNDATIQPELNSKPVEVHDSPKSSQIACGETDCDTTAAQSRESLLSRGSLQSYAGLIEAHSRSVPEAMTTDPFGTPQSSQSCLSSTDWFLHSSTEKYKTLALRPDPRTEATPAEPMSDCNGDTANGSDPALPRSRKISWSLPVAISSLSNLPTLISRSRISSPVSPKPSDDHAMPAKSSFKAAPEPMGLRRVTSLLLPKRRSSQTPTDHVQVESSQAAGPITTRRGSFIPKIIKGRRNKS